MATPAWCEAFLASRELTCRPSTLRLYRHTIATFADWLGERPMDSAVTRADLRELQSRGLARVVCSRRRTPSRVSTSAPAIVRKRRRQCGVFLLGVGSAREVCYGG